MNGLRQYMALMFFPFVFLAAIEKRYITYVILVVISCMFHQSAIVGLLILPCTFVSKLSRKSQMCLFFVIPILFSFSSGVISYFIDNYFLLYRNYLDNAYGEGLPISSIYTKIYYIPVFIYFWYLYIKGEDEVGLEGISQAIGLWICTYWLFVLYLDFGFIFRISSYFFFFNIFPLYVVWKSLVRRKKVGALLVFFMYLLAPYLAKVTFLSRDVFEYKHILF